MTKRYQRGKPSIEWSTDNIMSKRYQRGKPLIEEVQTTSWPKDTKGVSHQSSKKYRQHHDQKIPGKPSIWYLLVMKYRQHHDQKISFGHEVVCTSSITKGLPSIEEVLLDNIMTDAKGLTFNRRYLLVMMLSMAEVQTTSWPKDTKGVRSSQKYCTSWPKDTKRVSLWY